MYIELSKLSSPEFLFDYEIPLDLEDDSAKAIGDVLIKGMLRSGIAQVDIKGEVKADIEIECFRCLEPSDALIEAPFSISYIAEEFYTKEKESELHGDDLEIAIFDGEKIDISIIAREQVMLNIPMKAYCKEDCKGICPKCKANLNKSACNCENKDTDPRWSALKNFKKE
jgi:uncharacterized protein